MLRLSSEVDYQISIQRIGSGSLNCWKVIKFIQLRNFFELCDQIDTRPHCHVIYLYAEFYRTMAMAQHTFPEELQ